MVKINGPNVKLLALQKVMLKREMTNRLVESCHPLICDHRTLFDSPPPSCLTTTYKDLLSRLLLFVISPSCYSLSHILLFLIFSGRHLLTVCAKDNFERIDTTEISQNSLSNAALEAYAFVIRFIFANWWSIPGKVYVGAMPNLLLSASVTLWLISKK